VANIFRHSVHYYVHCLRAITRYGPARPERRAPSNSPE
jgi:hypothetical protein